MEAGTIVNWLKSEGERGREGRAAVRARHGQGDAGCRVRGLAGTLLKIAIERGRGAGRQDDRRDRRARRGSSLSRSRRLPSRSPTAKEAPQAPPAPEPVPEKPVLRVTAAPKASPLARRIARERGIHLATIRGTGPEGRIVAEDVERAEAAPAAAPSAPVARRRGRAARAHEHPAHDRQAAHGGVDDPGLRTPARRP